MKSQTVVCAAIVAALMPVGAHADDPNDPAMRSAAARARDREIIRQLNLQELARVRQRDAGYAQGWQEWRDGRGERDGYARDREDYARERARYERQMAAWRRAVAACRAGDHSACD